MKEQELLIKQRMKEEQEHCQGEQELCQEGAAGLEQQSLWMQGEEQEQLLQEWRTENVAASNGGESQRWGRDGVILGGNMLEGAGWWRRQRSRTDNDKARKKDDRDGLELKVGNHA